MKGSPDINDTLKQHGDDGVRRRSDGAKTYDPETPANLKNSPNIPLTAEDQLALRYADRYGDVLRYVAAWNKWMAWDETDFRWLHEDTLAAFDLAREICRETAANCTKPEDAKAVSSAKTVAAVEKMAKSDRRFSATIEQWDSHPWILNAHDYINLRTGVGYEADPGAYITKVTGSECAPAATPHPLWSAFLDRITAGDMELQGFLKRYIGYCLTGVTDEQVFVFAWGTGANGKSTFINTVAKVFGEYATAAPMSTFVVSQSEQHPTDLAKLVGSRLVVAQENQKGHQWNETRIKQMTGGDTISARFMRSDFFDYIPTFKIFICGNNKPRLANVDEAMRRRLLLVPFTVCIPEDERDPHLMKKLEAEHPAILRWCVDGCLEWQRQGLNPPSIVRDFTDEYFEDQDITQQWLDECTQDGGPYAFTTFADLYSSWKGWCDTRGFKPGSMKAFSETLSDRGFRKKKSGGIKGFASLTVAATAAAQWSGVR